MPILENPGCSGVQSDNLVGLRVLVWADPILGDKLLKDRQYFFCLQVPSAYQHVLEREGMW